MFSPMLKATLSVYLESFDRCTSNPHPETVFKTDKFYDQTVAQTPKLSSVCWAGCVGLDQEDFAKRV